MSATHIAVARHLKVDEQTNEEGAQPCEVQQALQGAQRILIMQTAVTSQATYVTVGLTIDGGPLNQAGHTYDANGVADIGGIAGLFHQGNSSLDFSYIVWTVFENNGVSVLDTDVRYNTFRVLLPLPVSPRAVGIVVSAAFMLQQGLVPCNARVKPVGNHLLVSQMHIVAPAMCLLRLFCGSLSKVRGGTAPTPNHVVRASCCPKPQSHLSANCPGTYAGR
jgi:hypothetical protein